MFKPDGEPPAVDGQGAGGQPSRGAGLIGSMTKFAAAVRALLPLAAIIGVAGAAHASDTVGAGLPPHAAADVAAHAVGNAAPMLAAGSVELKADQQFRSLFNTWKKLDGGPQLGVIAIPSVQPVEKLAFTSNFGIRSDPFSGTAHMHAGVDIPGPVGTPVYATADGTVDRAERASGYGNLVEIDHGKGIATRYGHLSKILIASGAHVHRGQLIALMGSTGRSTGPHLHYEVRIDGRAVNPAPFLTSTDYLLAAQDHSVNAIPISTDGPAAQD